MHFVINAEYAKRVQMLIDHAKTYPSATNDPAYRLIQILTRVRGGLNL